MIDKGIIDNIIESILKYCSQDIPLIEVGPGTGVLTQHLVKAYPDFKAIEFDRDMVRSLDGVLTKDQIIQADFLKTDLGSFGIEKCNVVGNFPYNISSQIIFKVLEERVDIPVALGMFQKEMAERICADPGTKANGVISIKTQAFYNTELLFNIPPEAFDPPPRVHSSIIVLTRNERDTLSCDPSLFKQVVNSGFSQRRKKLRNTLKAFEIDLEKEIFQKRPEQLSVEDFINIALSIEEKRNET